VAVTYLESESSFHEGRRGTVAGKWKRGFTYLRGREAFPRESYLDFTGQTRV
jgi:hypothetical protein